MARITVFAAWMVGTALLAGAGGTARAAEVDQAARDSFRSVITQQLEAFARGDAATAESFAAPGIKLRWPDPQGFVDMVKQAYAPLIGPRSTHFEAPGSDALGPMQKVTVIDKDGNAWTAVYTFEQVEGQWRINGCALVKEQSTNV